MHAEGRIPHDIEVISKMLDSINRKIAFFKIDKSALERIAVSAGNLRLSAAYLAINDTQNIHQVPLDLLKIDQWLPTHVPDYFINFYTGLEEIIWQYSIAQHAETFLKFIEEAAYKADNQISWDHYNQVKEFWSDARGEISEFLQRPGLNNDYKFGLTGELAAGELFETLTRNRYGLFALVAFNFMLRSKSHFSHLLAPEFFMIADKSPENVMGQAMKQLNLALRETYRMNINWSEFNPVQRNLHNWYFDKGYAISNNLKAEWNERQLTIIKFLFSKRTISTRELYGLFNCNRKTIQRDFKELMDSGMVYQERQGSALCYCLNLKEKIDFPSEIYNIHLPQSPETEVIKVAESDASEAAPKMRYGRKLAARAALSSLQLSFDYSSSSLNR